MGCFCEQLPNSGVVRHMEVIALMPGKSIVFTGALGPLQSIAAAGSMKFQLAAAEGDTKLEFTYAVTGYLPAGVNTGAVNPPRRQHECPTRGRRGRPQARIPLCGHWLFARGVEYLGRAGRFRPEGAVDAFEKLHRARQPCSEVRGMPPPLAQRP